MMAVQEAPTHPISTAELETFFDFFYKKTGIKFDKSKRYFIDKRISKRIEATGARNFREYFMKMRFEAAQTEFQELVNAMTVNETYFFREDHQLRCLSDHVMPELARARRGRPLRVLSLPCSTGEEPYSIAIQLLTAWPGIETTDVEIMGADIDTKVLNAAKRGVYNERSVHAVSATQRRRFFTGAGEAIQVVEELREAIEFLKLNIIDPPTRFRRADVDVVFCRNLLIYFDDVARRKAVENIYDALAPGGFVLLGHSESMSRISSLFRVRRLGDCVIYQKPDQGACA